MIKIYDRVIHSVIEDYSEALVQYLEAFTFVEMLFYFQGLCDGQNILILLSSCRGLMIQPGLLAELVHGILERTAKYRLVE